MKKDIKYLVLSDIHLGHPNNKTHEIISNLNKFFTIYSKDLVNLDLIILAGDVFDRLLSTRSIEYKQILSWLSNLLLYCKENNIILRILYGTPSHDNDQIAGFTEVASKLAPTADYKYISVLDIEYIPLLDINILYVPDEWKPNADDTYQDVLKLMKEKGLHQVDIAIMHGCFKYQLPMVDLPFRHTESSYLDIVKYYITIGHVHTPSAYERILAPGSFDRLVHGEEECKGGLLCRLFTDGTMSFKFLKNNYAKTFKTLIYSGLDETTIVNKLKNDLKGLKDDSYVRIEVDNDVKLLSNLKTFLHNYPKLNIKFKTDKTILEEVDIVKTSDLHTFEINIDNIEELMLKELNLNKDELVIFKRELERAIK